MRRWVRMPNPGQYRGEGEWMTIEDAHVESRTWERWHADGYLPTRLQDEKPAPDDGNDLETVGK